MAKELGVNDIGANVEIDLSDVVTLLTALEGDVDVNVAPVVKNNPELERVLIRSGVVLIATAWEVFINEFLQHEFTKILDEHDLHASSHLFRRTHQPNSGKVGRRAS